VEDHKERFIVRVLYLLLTLTGSGVVELTPFLMVTFAAPLTGTTSHFVL
jgi:hypothetical protein